MRRDRFLMCPPDHYDAHFLFNPWLEYSDEVDRDSAKIQWRALKHVIVAAGGEVSQIAPVFSESAMVYTRDNALVYAEGKVLLLRSVGPRGIREPKLLKRWFRDQGFAVDALPRGMHLEGGNMLFRDPHTLIAGYKTGEDIAAYRWLAEFYMRETGQKLTIVFVRLMSEKYLHLDMAISFLKEKAVLVYPPALNLGENWRTSTLWGGREVIELTPEETFGANAVVVNDIVLSAGLSPETRKRIESHGFKVVIVDLSEFLKGGGGAHCLTLDLMPYSVSISGEKCLNT